MIKSLIKAIADFVSWLVSPRRHKQKMRAERDAIAKAVHEGDEDTVNATIADLTKPICLALALICLLGCASPQTVYIPATEKVSWNAEKHVWEVPPITMAKLLSQLHHQTNKED